MQITKTHKILGIAAGILFIMLITGADESILGGIMPSLYPEGKLVTAYVTASNPLLEEVKITELKADIGATCHISPFKTATFGLTDNGKGYVSIGGATKSFDYSLNELDTRTYPVTFCAPLGSQTLTAKLISSDGTLAATMSKAVVVA